MASAARRGHREKVSQHEGDGAGGHCPDWEEQLQGQAQGKPPKICAHGVCTPGMHKYPMKHPLQGQFLGLSCIWSEPEVSQAAHSPEFLSSHPAAQEVSMTYLVGGFQLSSHSSPRIPPVAPQASPDPSPCQGQVWIPAGMEQHQARWESSPNGRARTVGKERARAEGGQMRSPLGMLIPKGDGWSP